MKYTPLMLPLLGLGLPAVAEGGLPPLQLAADYAPHHDPAAYLVSEKLDGVRAYWNGRQLLSRSGLAFAAPDWFVAGFPATPLDGELWLGHGRFAELSAAVRRFEPVEAEWRDIRFMVFDLPASELPFEARLAALNRLKPILNTPYLELVAQREVNDAAALAALLTDTEALGGEGLMLRHRHSRYLPERNQDLLKLRRFQDAEATVLARLPGQGKYAGMMGALLVQTPDGRRFRLGTGFSEQQRRHPPAPGTVVSYRYRGHTSGGLPRFASFWRVRHDAPALVSAPARE